MQRLRSSLRLRAGPSEVSVLTPVLLIVSSLACSEGASYEHPDDVQAKLTLTAQSGTFTALEDGLYALTLGGVSRTIGYSAEDPVAASGDASTREVLENYAWDEANPPSAAVVISDPAVSQDHDSMLLRLMLPTYDESTGTLSMYVQADTTYAGELLAPYASGADASLPTSFGRVTVFVESWWHHWSCSKAYITCYRHFGCCIQPAVTQPVGRYKVDRCWRWSSFSCQPCSDDPCASKYPHECGGGDCYISCADDCDPPPY